MVGLPAVMGEFGMWAYGVSRGKRKRRAEFIEELFDRFDVL